MHHLTRQTEIAIGILATCALSPASKLRTQYLADRTGTSKDHVAHILSLLARNGLLACDVDVAAGYGWQPELVRDAHGMTASRESGAAGLDMIVGASSAFFSQLVAHRRSDREDGRAQNCLPRLPAPQPRRRHLAAGISPIINLAASRIPDHYSLTVSERTPVSERILRHGLPFS